MITDRDAADLRAGKVVAEISNRVHNAVHARPQDSAMVLRRELMSGSTEMLQRLCEIYAALDGAADPPLVDELTNVVADRVSAFAVSTSKGAGGNHVAAAARLAVNVSANIRMGAASTFKLAAYDAHKDRPKPPPATATLPKIDEDAHAAFDRMPIHPAVRAVCGKQFADRHYRSAVLDAGIALIDYVKQRAGNPIDKHGNAYDGAPLMDRVFGLSAPLLKVNDLKDDSDKDEQIGMLFLFKGVAQGLRNPRAHSLDPDTAEYASEAIAMISFLYKVAEAATT